MSTMSNDELDERHVHDERDEDDERDGRDEHADCARQRWLNPGLNAQVEAERRAQHAKAAAASGAKAQGGRVVARHKILCEGSTP